VGLVLLNQRAKDYATASPVEGQGSMALNLKKWIEVMDKYEAGAFMYYTTLPTDALMVFRNAMLETKAYGFAKAKSDMFKLGAGIRAVLEKNGYKSVAGEGWKAPGVVVSYADTATMVGMFKAEGLQIAGGVPFMIDEPKGLNTFRLGLFGLDKIKNIQKTIDTFERALNGVKVASSAL
jgi:aspartate aminotransferase-like enzyme